MRFAKHFIAFHNKLNKLTISESLIQEYEYRTLGSKQ